MTNDLKIKLFSEAANKAVKNAVKQLSPLLKTMSRLWLPHKVNPRKLMKLHRKPKLLPLRKNRNAQLQNLRRVGKPESDASDQRSRLFERYERCKNRGHSERHSRNGRRQGNSRNRNYGSQRKNG